MAVAERESIENIAFKLASSSWLVIPFKGPPLVSTNRMIGVPQSFNLIVNRVSALNDFLISLNCLKKFPVSKILIPNFFSLWKIGLEDIGIYLGKRRLVDVEIYSISRLPLLGHITTLTSHFLLQYFI